VDDFQKITTALREINRTLQSQSNEILELRNQVQNLIQANTPSSSYAVIEPDCGYEWMWARIQHQ
jgi:RES domain-containing protein